MTYRNSNDSPSIFYGWWIVAATFFTLGLAVGLPYFGMPFFYDYFERPINEGGFGWSRSVITLGLPLGTLATLWVGPALAHRFSSRRLILIGTGLTALTLFGFGKMQGAVWLYWPLWVSYMMGNVLSGGLSHQVILSNWFVKHRGTALSIAYLGISVIGAFSARFVVKPISDAYGFRITLQMMGVMVLLAWPLIFFVIKERPSEISLSPDGEKNQPETDSPGAEQISFGQVIKDRTFLTLLIGGSFSVGAVGAVSQHLKLILKDSGFTDQSQLNLVFSQTMLVLLVISAAGRLLVGRLADSLPKRQVMTVTFVLMAASLPFLLIVQPPATPYLFAVLFGLSMGGDFLLVALMAADSFSGSSLARVLSLLLPTMTVGQTWFPYFIAVLREWTGNYTMPLIVIFLCATVGWIILVFIPTGKQINHGLQTAVADQPNS